MEFTEFFDELDIGHEIKSKAKDDWKVFGLNNWKDVQLTLL